MITPSERLLVAFTSAKPGQEQTYDRWYNDVHIPEVLSDPVVDLIAGSRYELEIANRGTMPHAHLSLYNIAESADPNQLVDALREGMRTRFTLSDSLDLDALVSGVFRRTFGPYVPDQS